MREEFLEINEEIQIHSLPIYQYSIGIHDGIQPVSYGENGTFRKNFMNSYLNNPISAVCKQI